MNVSIYHNPRCSKSRTTLELLEEAGLKPKVILYLETPPSVEEMKQLLKMLGMKASELVRKEEAADANIDPSALDEDAMIAAMLRHRHDRAPHRRLRRQRLRWAAPLSKSSKSSPIFEEILQGANCRISE